jgi:hypothetical protein
MKTRFKYGLSCCTGTIDDLVLYYDKRSDRIYARRYCIPKASPENVRLAATTRNIFALEPSPAFKHDLKAYLLLYNNLKTTHYPFRSWVTLFTHLMSRLAKSYPEIDLKTLTRNDIFVNDLPCKSVSRAVQAGLLSPVPGWEGLVAEM